MALHLSPAAFSRALLFPLLLASHVLAATPFCEHGGTRIFTDFPGARINTCSWLAGNTFTLTSLPEDTSVTNNSPWYALKVDTTTPRDVTVYLHYAGFKHRYQPKISVDGEHWELLPTERQQLSADGTAIKLELPVGEQGLWLAGQELFTEQHYAQWLQTLSNRDDVTQSRIGTSLAGRAITMLDIDPANKKRYIAIIGRQHPPEVTGAIGMQAFVERLLEEEPLANRFRSHWGIVLLPLLNPDGVHAGNWRHSKGGIDLNRDWGPFTQPETRSARDELLRRQTAGKKLDIFLDFHSTAVDVFYTQLPGIFADHAGVTRSLDSDWLQSYEALMQQSVPDYKANIQPGHNPDKPTSKAWVYEQFDVPAITVEYGDETAREFIRTQARAAAESLMQTLIDKDTSGTTP